MKLLTELKVKLNYTEADVLFAVRKKYSLFADEIQRWEIVKESIDARKKPDIFMKLNIAVDVKKSGNKKVQGLVDISPDHTGLDEIKVD